MAMTMTICLDVPRIEEEKGRDMSESRRRRAARLRRLHPSAPVPPHPATPWRWLRSQCRPQRPGVTQPIERVCCFCGSTYRCLTEGWTGPRGTHTCVRGSVEVESYWS